MKPTIMLTFDDGPSEWTDPILDLLGQHRAHATFFVIGANIEGNEHILRRIAEDGHRIGNHTFNHPRIDLLRNQRAWAELEKTSDLIEDVTGKEPTIWRAPYLQTNKSVDMLAAGLGLTHVSATVHPADWQDSAVSIAEHVLRRMHDGSIVDLHDGIPPDGGTGSDSRANTVEALGNILADGPANYVTVGDGHLAAA